MKHFYQLSIKETLEQLNSSESGLSLEVVPLLQEKFGDNALEEAKQKSRISILLLQFADIMIIILIVAAVISFIAGEHTDAYIILAIITGNAWMGYSQEYKAEKSIRMLKNMSASYAMVLRNNKHEKIEAKKLVPGDIIILEAGDIIPADARLLEMSSFKTDEASLTGESSSAEKKTAARGENSLVPGDQDNMIFKGTIVNSGSAKAVVTATGMNTELGKIANLMEVGFQKTPLQKRLALFSKQLAVIVIVICILIFSFGLWKGLPPFQMFLTALSLAVAALPEALPAIITIALAQGASRMAQQKALMRKLPAVETLGSVTYICSDKTGTLTQNTMTVEKLQVVPEKEELLEYAMLLNNDVKFSEEGLLGDSTETALVEYALQKGVSKEQADKQFPHLAKLPFDSERMRMSTLHKYGDKWILFVKGAPVRIVETLSGKHKEQVPHWLQINRNWAAEGLRVLFFSYKIFDKHPGDITPEIENDLDFLGITAMIDPPREEVIDAIKQCKNAGIETVMITGDQPLTATAIAVRLRMIEPGHDGVKSGADLDKLSTDGLRNLVRNTNVYARVSPKQKLDIVKSLQNNGEFVAMTGDGVNDAPSLKQADIGIAMGITGTDVSKEAADMILMDDNFATIVKAIKEGRRIYDNIRKFIYYVLSCNLAEILTMFLAPVLGFAIPLLPIHILWINLVTDGLPGLALVSEPAEKNVMTRPPRAPEENLFAQGLISKILISGAFMTAASLFIQWWAKNQGLDVKTQQTMVFTTLCFVQLGNALSSRSVYNSIFTKQLFKNKAMWGAIALTVTLQMGIVYLPFLQVIFKTTSLQWPAMGLIVIVALYCALWIEFLKRVNIERAPKPR